MLLSRFLFSSFHLYRISFSGEISAPIYIGNTVAMLLVQSCRDCIFAAVFFLGYHTHTHTHTLAGMQMILGECQNMIKECIIIRELVFYS